VIPCDRIRQIIVTWVERDRASHAGSGGATAHGRNNRPCGLLRLSELCGISERSLHDIVHHRRHVMRFDTADRILTATGNVNMWFTELSDLYPHAPHDDDITPLEQPTVNTKNGSV